MGFRFRRLLTENDLNHYRQRISKQIDVLLPLSYLKRSKVIGCFDENDELCGGFALVLKGPFRVIDSIPTTSKSLLKINNSSRVAEVTGLWMSQKIVKANQSFRFWIKLLTTLLISGKVRFVYAYSLRKVKLMKLYGLSRPKVLFRGRTKILPGMDNPEDESIELVGIKNIIFLPLLAPQAYIKRAFGVRRQR